MPIRLKINFLFITHHFYLVNGFSFTINVIYTCSYRSYQICGHFNLSAVYQRIKIKIKICAVQLSLSMSVFRWHKYFFNCEFCFRRFMNIKWIKLYLHGKRTSFWTDTQSQNMKLLLPRTKNASTLTVFFQKQNFIH